MDCDVYLVCKSSINKNWSNSIEEQFDFIISNELFGSRKVRKVYFSSNLFSAVRLSYSMFRMNPDLIVVHHTICLWPIYIMSLFKSSTRVISLLHEGEIAFERKYDFSSIKKFFSSWLRSNYFYHKIPQIVSDKTYVLTDFQAEILKLKNYRQINFLGVSSEKVIEPLEFGDIKSKGVGNLKCFFPFSPLRREKGYSLLETAPDFCSIFYPDNISNNKMWNGYISSDVVIIPSIELETYSLVLIEAMQMNKFIIASKKLGLVMNLMKKYSLEDLEGLGLYIVSPTSEFVNIAINKVNEAISGGRKSKVMSIYNNEGLDIKSATVNLVNKVIIDAKL